MPTRLEIINDMLAATGTAQLSAASGQHPAYIKANAKLTKADRVMQSRGWWFNKTTRTLRPNTAGEIILPTGTMHADPVDTGKNYVIRGGKLYDIQNATSVISADVPVVLVELVEIEDLPSTAATLLQAHAVYSFYVDANGGEPKLTAYLRDLQEAEARMAQEDLRNKDINFFKGMSYSSFRRVPGGGRLPV